MATCSTNDGVDVQLSSEKLSLHLDGPRNLDFAKGESCPVYYLSHFREIGELLHDLPETNLGSHPVLPTAVL